MKVFYVFVLFVVDFSFNAQKHKLWSWPKLFEMLCKINEFAVENFNENKMAYSNRKAKQLERRSDLE